MAKAPASDILDEGALSFTIDSRIVRELGERLVKKPEVALIELIKNAYDADATVCSVVVEGDRLVVSDNGLGMTFGDFHDGWMRVGTGLKAKSRTTQRFKRSVTGEKGIGRFATRFLGKQLHLVSTALDEGRKQKTLLTADFNWSDFDSSEDLGQIRVPYRLRRTVDETPTGTSLEVTDLSPQIRKLDLGAVRTASIGVLSPYQAMLQRAETDRPSNRTSKADPGFELKITPTPEGTEDDSVAGEILQAGVLRAVLKADGKTVTLDVFRRDRNRPVLHITDAYPGSSGRIYADIRFFPKRPGTYSGLSVDGRRARAWVAAHSGVAVFDRSFRIHPYGDRGDDWLRLSADAARRYRDPRSSLAMKYFPMDDEARNSTQLNYMLRLPYPEQLVGVVQVEGRRSADHAEGGLIPAADREGFIDNDAFSQLWDLVRGAVEAIASADRELQLAVEREVQRSLVQDLRRQTRTAIKEVEANPAIPASEKKTIVDHIARTGAIAERHEQLSQEREAALQTMSLLGVVAGFMTHEFGAALDDLERAAEELDSVRKGSEISGTTARLRERIAALKQFGEYAEGYVRGASSLPDEPYPVAPRIRRAKKLLDQYAIDRHISVEIEVDRGLEAPLVPVSLYDGVALNLLTNALKAVTARTGGERRILFRAWNTERHHFLEASDTGIGIPVALRERVFDPLFSTTSKRRDPLGSGMGLGLTLIKRNLETYGGTIEVTDPADGFTTTVKIRIPLRND